MNSKINLGLLEGQKLVVKKIILFHNLYLIKFKIVKYLNEEAKIYF